MSMAQASKDNAVIDSSTKRLKMTGYGSKRLQRLFSGSNIEVIYMDGVTALDQGYFFEHMTSLKAAIFPDAETIVSYVFWNTNVNSPIPGIDLYKKISFGSAIPFRLEGGGDIILRSNEMCPTAFTASAWGGSSGLKFYVPQALLSVYRADTNWGTFGDLRILPIEGSKYQNLDWWKSI